MDKLSPKKLLPSSVSDFSFFAFFQACKFFLFFCLSEVALLCVGFSISCAVRQFLVFPPGFVCFDGTMQTLSFASVDHISFSVCPVGIRRFFIQLVDGSFVSSPLDLHILHGCNLMVNFSIISITLFFKRTSFAKILDFDVLILVCPDVFFPLS